LFFMSLGCGAVRSRTVLIFSGGSVWLGLWA
jgi:hypothetical protein